MSNKYGIFGGLFWASVVFRLYKYLNQIMVQKYTQK